MRGIWAVSVIFSVLILSSFTVADAMTKSELVEHLGWNAETQSFVIEGIVSHGTAKAAQNANFALEVTISCQRADIQRVATYSAPLSEFVEIVKNPGTKSHAVVFAELADEDFTGIGISCGGGMFQVQAHVLNPAGKSVADSGEKNFEVEIIPPGTPVTVFFHDVENIGIPNSPCAVGYEISGAFNLEIGTTDSDGFAIITIPSTSPDLLYAVCSDPAGAAHSVCGNPADLFFAVSILDPPAACSI